MTRKILVVSETKAGFHDKLTYKTIKSFADQKCFWDILQSPINQTTIRDIIGHAIYAEADQIHISRLLNPVDLLDALSYGEYDHKLPPISFLIFGLAGEFRDEKRRDALRKLSYAKKISKIILMSIHPDSCLGVARQMGLNTDKIVVLHEPPYEYVENYRSVSKEKARNNLKIGQDLKFVLYFGTYFFSKGPDIALAAARICPEVHFCFVGKMSLGSIEINRKEYDSCNNIHFWDEYVSEDTARDWFRACDAVILPYRRFYTHDSSGIFNQAMLAERPVLAPSFPPFSYLIWNHQVGKCFVPEDAVSLAGNVKGTIYEPYYNRFGYDEYLKEVNSWDDIAKEVLNGNTEV